MYRHVMYRVISCHLENVCMGKRQAKAQARRSKPARRAASPSAVLLAADRGAAQTSRRVKQRETGRTTGAPERIRVNRTTDATPTPPPQPAPMNNQRDALVRQAELIISYVLRGGVLISGAVIVIGAAIFYARYLNGSLAFDRGVFPHSFGSVAQGVAQGNPLAIIAAGLLLLLLTPVLRVAVSIVAFLLERDWLYTVITIIVLAILIISFLLGKGGA